MLDFFVGLLVDAIFQAPADAVREWLHEGRADGTPDTMTDADRDQRRAAEERVRRRHEGTA